MGKYQINGKQILYVEAGVYTDIAQAGDTEKAHFLAAACNSFGIVSGYIDNALVTLSPSWHGDKIAKAQFLGRINGAIDAANKLDQVKKTLFYGRDNNLIAEGQTPIGDGPLEHMGNFNASPANIIHGVIGIFTEAGELLEMLRDAYNGNGFDPINMREEIGDMFWYVAILLAEASRDGDGMTFEDAMRVNIEKLRARFPDKFSERSANERNLAAEREILEDKRPALPAEGAIVGDPRKHHAGPVSDGNEVTMHDGLLPKAEAELEADEEAGFTAGEPPLIIEAEEASGKPAVERAAASSAAAFRAVDLAGQNVGKPEPSPQPLGDLAKPTSERASPLPQESMAQANGGAFDNPGD